MNVAYVRSKHTSLLHRCVAAVTECGKHANLLHCCAVGSNWKCKHTNLLNYSMTVVSERGKHTSLLHCGAVGSSWDLANALTYFTLVWLNVTESGKHTSLSYSSLNYRGKSCSLKALSFAFSLVTSLIKWIFWSQFCNQVHENERKQNKAQNLLRHSRSGKIS
jgi:hypothetical protein